MFEHLFLQVGALLGITVGVAFIMRLLKQPLMTAYLIAGIIAGPFVLNFLHGDVHVYDTLAEFGVVLLLFVVGLSLNIEHIKKIGKVSLFVGSAQILFTASIGFLITHFLLGMELFSAAYLSIGITFSSTIIIVKLLADKKANETVYGRYTLGIMVVQDLIALFLMIFLTSLAGDITWVELGRDLLLKILFLAAIVYVLARFVAPFIMDKVARSSEFLFIFTIAWCFGISSILLAMGFSLEVGALIAGLILGSSPYQREIISRVTPLRDFFIVIFFLILGSELSLSDINSILVPGTILGLFILLGNPFILYHSFRLFKFTRRNSFLAGMTAAQVSEFGFILLFTGIQMGHIEGKEIEVFTMVALITIISSSYMISYSEKIYDVLRPVFNFFGPDKYQQEEVKEETFDVWVFGYHRMGWKICEMLKEKDVSFAVVDFDPSAMNKLRRRGFTTFYGDAADVEFLSELPIGKSKLVISTLPSVDDQRTLFKQVKVQADGEEPLFIGNVYQLQEVDDLYDAGADFVMMPHMVGGNWISDILRDKEWTPALLDELKAEQSKELALRFKPTDHD